MIDPISPDSAPASQPSVHAPHIAIIGGSGLDTLPGFEVHETRVVETAYGTPSAPLSLGLLDGQPVAFLPRHGSGHQVAPHAINYRANIAALAKSGITQILACCAVGGISEAMAPRAVVLPDQIIDYTWGREHTFVGGAGPECEGIAHIDFSEPFCPALRAALCASAAELATASEVNVSGATASEVADSGATASEVTASEKASTSVPPVVVYGCYGATQGPRLETPAEIRRLARDGCDLVGMTGMPEAALAREAGLGYAMLAIVANRAAGLEDADLTIEDILANIEAARTCVLDLLIATVRRLNNSHRAFA